LAAIESRDRATILIHFYRAMVGRADIWRMRMDTTTNWAIGATAAVVSFALGNPALPHYAVLMAPLLTACFLMLEARRLTFYHLWQGRVLQLEQGLVRPALRSGVSPEALEALDDGGLLSDEELVCALDPQLGHTAPSMPIQKAVARRLRRIYLYLFVAQWLAWLFKLSNHPTPVASLDELAARAAMGPVPGAASLVCSAVALAACAAIAWRLGGIDRARRR